MPKVLIISPDPEERRILALALELSGLAVASALDPMEAREEAQKADALLLDMVDDGDEQWDAARTAQALARDTGRPAILLLPRGRDAAKLPRGIEAATISVRKPFELLDLVARVGRLASGSRLAGTQATPAKGKAAARVRRAPAAKKGRARKAAAPARKRAASPGKRRT